MKKKNFIPTPKSLDLVFGIGRMNPGHILKLRAVFDIGQKGNFIMKKGTFFKKRAPKIPPPYSIPFLSVLRQNKALYNFRKRGQRSIVERNIGLKYPLEPPNTFQLLLPTTVSWTVWTVTFLNDKFLLTQ